MIGCDDTKLINEEKEYKKELDNLTENIIKKHKEHPEKYLK